MTTTLLAIEVKTEDVMPLVNGIAEGFADLTFESVKGHFLVFGFENENNDPVPALVPPTAIENYFDHIENGPEITLKQMVRK